MKTKNRASTRVFSLRESTRCSAGNSADHADHARMSETCRAWIKPRKTLWWCHRLTFALRAFRLALLFVFLVSHDYSVARARLDSFAGLLAFYEGAGL